MLISISYPCIFIDTPSPTPIPNEAEFEHHSFKCLSDCVGFVGMSRFGTYMNETCAFLGPLFNECDSYAVAHGLCKVNECAKDCAFEDWCYFASGFIASCPCSIYSSCDSWKAKTLASTEITAQCTKSLTAIKQSTGSCLF